MKLSQWRKKSQSGSLIVVPVCLISHSQSSNFLPYSSIWSQEAPFLGPAHVHKNQEGNIIPSFGVATINRVLLISRQTSVLNQHNKQTWISGGISSHSSGYWTQLAASLSKSLCLSILSICIYKLTNSSTANQYIHLTTISYDTEMTH